MQISPLLSSPEAVRRLLRVFAIVLSVGILSGAYNFLLFTFNNDISQRRGYMSSAIAEAHTFFTTREALLESLSLSAVRKGWQAEPLVYLPSFEEVHLQLGDAAGKQWSIWLTRRMCDYLRAQQVSLCMWVMGRMTTACACSARPAQSRRCLAAFSSNCRRCATTMAHRYKNCG